jgi:hypothetical protein
MSSGNDYLTKIAELEAELKSRIYRIDDLEYRNGFLADTMEELKSQNAHLEAQLRHVALKDNGRNHQCYGIISPVESRKASSEKRSREDEGPLEDYSTIVLVKMTGFSITSSEQSIRDLLSHYSSHFRYFQYQPGAIDVIFQYNRDATRCQQSLDQSTFEGQTITVGCTNTDNGRSFFVKINNLPSGVTQPFIRELIGRFGELKYFRLFRTNAEAIFVNNDVAIKCAVSLHNSILGGNTITSVLRLQDAPPARPKPSPLTVPGVPTGVRIPTMVQAPMVQVPPLPLLPQPLPQERDLQSEAIAGAIRLGIVHGTLILVKGFPLGRQEGIVRGFLSTVGELTFVVFGSLNTIVNFRTALDARQGVQSLLSRGVTATLVSSPHDVVNY